MNEKTVATGKKVLMYLTIGALILGLLSTGLGFVVDIVQRDSIIVGNKADVIALKNEVAELRRAMIKTDDEFRKIITRMDKQLILVSAKLNVEILD